jgi:UDP-N-acetylglucosamine 2-epimerase (non-hydrolysing)/GDP/UDP-N,N'-diacetylbacillosamine 2-epimerase (hydrolysing)
VPALKICVVSGSRAEFGLLLEPMRQLHADPSFSLALVLTGQNVVPQASDALEIANAEKFRPVVRVDMHLDSDDPASVTKASGRALTGYADAFQELRPDLVLLLGDRYEILCAALAATLARIPIAHISGGDVTAGAMDDAFRHAITMMAHIHFVTTKEAANRVRQLGESPERIHLTGSPGVDLAMGTPVMTREAFFQAAGLVPRRKNVLVTFHPVTREFQSIANAEELVAALEILGSEVAFLVTGSNADPEGETVGRVMRHFAENRENARFVASLGSTYYFNALRHMDVMVGNSSSGLLEAPTFGLPAVNIGTRQDGRLMAASVIHCVPERAEIVQKIEEAFARGRQVVVNPYGDGHASERIVAVLKSITDTKKLLIKRFRDVAA